MLKRRKFLIGGLIILVAMGFLGFVGFQRSATYYYTVSELVSQGNLAPGENVKVNGQVTAGTITPEAGRVMRFTITEGGQSLPVVYQGAVPDAFKAGVDIVIEGHLNSTGVFQASSILTKCPSKYEPQQQ